MVKKLVSICHYQILLKPTRISVDLQSARRKAMHPMGSWKRAEERKKQHEEGEILPPRVIKKKIT